MHLRSTKCKRSANSHCVVGVLRRLAHSIAFDLSSHLHGLAITFHGHDRQRVTVDSIGGRNHGQPTLRPGACMLKAKVRSACRSQR